MRLFFALWPDAGAAEALARLAGEVAVEAGGRAVPAEKLHLTLAFLGEVPQARIPLAQAAGAGIAAPAFVAWLDRVGAFRQARVAWAGMSRPAAELLALQASLAAALAAEGFPIEDRPYVPHLTLARRIDRGVRARAIAPVAWEAGELTLVRTLPGNGDYATIARWPLGG